VTLRPGEITVITPTILPRAILLGRARASVAAQKRPADAHVIMVDHEHNGPGPTRNAALALVETEWVAFLDDDDELLPHHLRALEKMTYWSAADVIYPLGRYVTGDDPLRQMGVPFDAGRLRAGNFIPVTVLARTAAVRAVGGFPTPDESPRMGPQPCEDWGLWLRMIDNGSRFAPLHQVTWLCHTHTGPYGNTSGTPWVDHRDVGGRAVWEEDVSGVRGPRMPGATRTESRRRVEPDPPYRGRRRRR
jgi:hypothetical protein